MSTSESRWGAGERSALVEEPARRVVWEPRGPGVIAQIERWMAQTPEAPALLWDGGRLDYGQLDARTRALAAVLRGRGVGPDRTVAVVAERGAPQIVGMLAALRAGGAYVAITPELPDARIGWILDDTRPVVILCDGPPPAAVECWAGAVVRLDPPWPESPDRDVSDAVPADALAYIIYTSGSTGRPKGVLVPRRGFDAQLRWMQDEYPLAPRDRMLQLASATFDFSVVEMFWPLMAGGAVILPRHRGELDPAYLVRLAAEQAATVVNFAPAMLRAVIDACRGTPWTTIERLFSGGEAVTLDLVRDHPAVFPRAVLHNQYGPTETAINATHWRCRPGDAAVPIGRPVADTTVYVLDDELAPVPPGEVGQLWIGGVQLARGYLRRPGLTADRFRPNPFGARAGERIYQTGDLVRQRPDGVIDFVGRADFQVKVRGFRIELGEIEAALLDHGAVRAAVVVARDARPGDAASGKALIGYVCLAAGGAATPGELQGFLAARLPAYMIPSAFAVLDELPVTASGKLDRKALPAPGDDAYPRSAYVAPATPTEQRVAEIWAEVLGSVQVGRDDEFFALGGHSLLAVRAISRLRGALGVELPLRALFEASSVERLAREIDRRLGEGGDAGVPPLVPLSPEDRAGGLVLSSAQQRLWFLHQLDPDSCAYTMASAHRVRGALDVEALRGALEALIARHEALRTVVRASGGAPRQEVLPAGRFALAVEDLSGLAAEDREGEAARRAEAAMEERFDLATGPLFRARVVRLSETEHVLLVELHHIIADGGSMDVLWRELAALYGGAVAGEPARLAALPVQYADHAAWLARWLTGEVLEGQLAYWRGQLADAPVDLALPYRAGPPPSSAGYRGARIEQALDGELTRRLQALGQQHGATLFMVLSAALRVVIARMTGQRDVCLGTAIANRDRAEIEGVIGMFVNTLVLRGEVRAGDRFVDVLARERDVALSAYAHAHAPFEQVVDALGLPRDPGRMPLIQVMCVDQGEVDGESALPGLRVEPFRTELEIAPFELLLDTRERGGVRELAITYQVDRFERGAVAALVERYERLLVEIVARPERPVVELARTALLGAGERTALFEEPARRVAWEPRGPGVIAQIERWMAETPEAPALIWDGGRIDYGELGTRTRALAAVLRGRGVAADRMVAVVAERSAAQIVGIVGVLRAGGAYVPIKPDLPDERVGWIVEETDPVVILCEGAPPAGLGRWADRVVRLDEPWPEPVAGDAGVDEAAVPGDALAYVIYTSGSTGRPKGVMISRRNFDAQLRWTLESFPIGAAARCLQVTSAMFDVSVPEMFWPLMAGGGLVLLRPGGEMDPGYLAGLAGRHGVTAVHFVPSLFRVVIDACRGTPWTTVEQVFCAGEALALDLIRDCPAVFPRAALYNQYGPTETTVIATHWDCHPDDATAPIGRPVADTTVYVLDDELAPVPPGGVGQLWIGGVQLARGYLQRPGLTADRFRPNPFGARPGERIYQTGDLVRQRADGVIDYLGRADFQVKVRGFRIELGEIEAALLDHPEVRATVVVARDPRPGDAASGRVLVGYVCLAAGGAATPAELQGFLGARLPAYMIPSAFVVLDELPLTTTGKLDRKALPAPDDDAYQRGAYVAPATPTEQRVAEILGEVLGAAGGSVQVGRHDDFFAIGGHSLLAVRAISRLRTALGVELPLRALFEAPTVEQLAREVDRRSARSGDRDGDAGGGGAGLPLVRLSPEDRAGGLVLSSAQQRLWFLQELDPDSRAYNMFLAHRLRGPLDLEALRGAFEALIGRHDALRTVFPATGGVPRQEVMAAGRFALPVDDLSALPAEDREGEAARRAEAAMVERFDLATGPLFRARVIRLSDTEHVLLLELHHIIADGWSLDVLWRELAALYGGAVAGRPPALAAPPVQYADYAAWLARWLTGEVLEGQLAYWRRQLADAPADLALPYRAPEPGTGDAGVGYRGARIDIALDAEVTRRLRALARQHGATMFMVMSAALRVLIARTTGQRDLCLGTAVASRDRAEIEGVVGMFVNTLVLRGAVAPDDRFVDVLARERDVALSAYAHAHAPFELVIDALGLPRDPGRMPLIQVMCVDQGEVDSEPALPGLTTEPFRTELEITDFDLIFDTRERGRVCELTVSYQIEWFERDVVAALVEHYRRLLVEIAEHPERALSELAQPAQIERWAAQPLDAQRVLDTGRVDGERDAAASAPALPRHRGVGRALAYWRQQLAGAPTGLELPTDRPRPAVASFAAATAAFEIDAELTRALEALGRAHGSGLYLVLQCAWAALLGRYSRQDEVVVGAPGVQRCQPVPESEVGWFGNALALRHDLSGAPSFAELLGRSRAMVVAAFEHRDLPFAQLVEAIQPEPDRSRHPVVQTALVLDERPAGGSAGGSIAPLDDAALDLGLRVIRGPGGLAAEIRYAAALFEPASVAHLARQLGALLRAVAAAPGAALHTLALSDDAERAQLAAWNATAAPRGGGCLHDWIAAQAARTPAAVAVIFEGEALAYRELLARANQLAHHLRARGVGPDVIVAVLLERSLDLMVALLGILQAGGAYLALDPEHPAERLAFAVRDAAAPVLITTEALASRPGLHGAHVVRMDADRGALAGEPTRAPDTGCTPDHLAYVLYTSGSTGVPKGVENHHAGIVNRLLWHQRQFALGPGDRVLQKTPYTFDVSVWELFWPLMVGATLVVARPGGHREPAYLAGVIAAHDITCLHFVPSMLRAFVEELGEHGAGRRWPALRWVLCSGEALSPELVALAYPRLGLSTEIHNLYGPTEAAVDVTHAPCRPDDSGFVPIGRPVSNTQIYVVDDGWRQAPIGVPGELCIGGVQVARGYLRRPGLTADRFVPDPFSAAPGARMYRTGDLARYRATGQLEYLGRLDHQVKLRGLRIELGEIEAALRDIAGVRDAVVIVRDERLAAYVVAEPGELPAREQVRARLAARLPAYMVPDSVTALAAFPLTTSGKLDRKALPAPDDAHARSAYVAPATPTEQRVAEIWAEVLGAGGRSVRVGRDDEFFALGGHSLLAVRAISRLRAALGVELPLRALFEASSVERLAREIDRRLTEGCDAGVPPLVPLSAEERAGGLVLSSAQQRLWFLHQLDPDSCAYTMASAHRVRGALDVEALRGALEALIARHEALRTVVRATDGVPRQEVLPAGRFALAVEDLSGLAAEDREGEAGRRAEAAMEERFDLATGPLFRARVLRLSETEHVLLVELHHIIADGGSMDVLWRELAALYGGAVAGEPARLAALPVQCADHAAWLARWLTGEVLEGQLAYWRGQLADAPVDLALPYRAGPPPSSAGYRGARIEQALDGELTRRLQALGQQHGATLFMVLTAALRVVIARMTGQRDVCLGTAIGNRDRAEIEGVIGMFVNTLVLRGEVRAGDRFVDVLARERDVALSAYAHAHAPFEQVVDALGLPRDPGRMPLIQVMCVDQGEVSAEGGLPGLESEPFRTELEIAPFDLLLDTRERGGVRELAITYQVDRFEREAVAALVERYERLLVEIAGRPERPVVELARTALLGAGERTALFEEPARRVAWEPRGPGVIAQIERWMAETPEAPALIWDGGRIDYGELGRRTRALAGVLRGRGVAADRMVAVVAERSAAQIVGIIGALRAGGAYVPIKPDLPDERVGWIVEETDPVVILCEGAPPAGLGRWADRVVRLDEPWPEPVAGVDEPGVPGDALAYVIYTSGSTGRPKGVMISRRNFDAQLRWTLESFPIGPAARCLQVTSAMFDVSVPEMFWPLMAGGGLVLLRPGGEMDPGYLAGLAGRHGVTAVHFVPSLFRVVIDACRGTPWTTVEQVFCAGEALALDLIRDSAGVFPRAALYNQYGPTETTVIATHWDCHPDDTAAPIGRPVADTTVYVLDDELAPVPPGGVGQLWIGGVQLARGYLQRPGLTADRFRPNPFGARPGERIYQTGDLVRQRADGVIDYLGRADFQVKVRGFRIELGEIEAALLDHPEVRATVVVARDPRPEQAASGKVLVGYVCLAAGGAATPAELQGFLGARLPAYMIPSAFVVLDELPLTTTGKLDRKALPAPDDDAYQRAAYAAPATPMQELLAQIWRDVLGVDQVGRDDSFFALGGHSLLVVQLVASVRRELGVELPIRSVFESPTVAQLAERVALLRGASASGDDPAERELIEQVAALSDAEASAQLADGSSAALAPAPPAASGLAGARRALAERLIAQHRIDLQPSQPLARRTHPTAPATFAQQLQWDWHHRGNFPTLGIHATAFSVRGPLDIAAMRRAIADLVERQASLRTVFHVEGDRLVHTMQDTGPGLDVVDLPGVPAAERTAHARRLFEAISRPHDLSREVFRAQVVRLAADDHLLYLAPHHIVVDGFSWGVLEADLAALYRARAAGAGAELEPLELACRDFSAWQRGLEDRPAGRAQLAFWERAVAGYAGLELPGDGRAADRGTVGMATDTYAAGAIPFAIDGARWAAIERVCARLGCTPYVVITSGFLLLLSRWSGRGDVCVLSSNFHRNRPGSDAVIGNFVTPYPLRVVLDDRDSLDAALRRCHDRVLANREHAHVAPASALAAWVEWSRYNVNYQIAPPGDAIDYGAVRVERLDWCAHARRTPHDLGLFVRQGARGLAGELVYSAERFSPELAARAAARLGRLIDLIATDPAHVVGSLPRIP